jgi:hypothetical protein
MTVQEFTKELNEGALVDIKNELEIKHYIPIMEKKKFVMGVIAACTDDYDGFIQADRFKMNIYFNIQMLSLYTKLEPMFDFDEMIEHYDILCEYGVMSAIINMIGTDYNALKEVLECELNSLISQNSIDLQVVKIANKINEVTDVLGEMLNNINLDDILPKGIDASSLTKVLNMFK